MATFTYDVSQYFLVIGGLPIQGFQDGSEISVEMDEDVFTKQVDIDGGNVTFSKTNNRMATCTFTLNEGSAANDILSGFYQAFIRTSGGVVPFLLKDNNGRSVVATAACAVQSLPSVGGGRESGGREWTIGLGQTEFFVGGAEAAA